MYEWIGSMTGNERVMKRIGTWTRFAPGVLIAVFCWAAGIVWFMFARQLRRKIRRNMRELLRKREGFGPVRVYRTSAAFFGQLALTFYELFVESRRLPHAVLDKTESDSFMRSRFRIEGEHHLQQALSHGKGAIVFAPHLGNFFYYYWALSRKADCLAVVTAGSDELRPIYLTFRDKGCRGLDYDETPPLKLLGALRRHLARGGIVFLLGDFWRPAFPPSSLFGLPNRSPGGTALLALAAEAPVVPFYGHRTVMLRHRLVFGEPLLLHERFDKRQREAATDVLNGMMERMIESVPSQWFYWFNVHERWQEAGLTGEAS